MSGASKSRRVAIGLAKNGCQHPSAVATDRRTREAEVNRSKRESHFTKLHRKLDMQFQAHEHSEEKRK